MKEIKKKIPKALLAAVSGRALNVHASLLPRWRGAAPIAHAILAGDPETGVTLMEGTAELDAGPILAQTRTKIGDETRGELEERLAKIGGELLEREMPRYLAGKMVRRPQDQRQVTLAPKLEPRQGELDLSRFKNFEELIYGVFGKGIAKHFMMPYNFKVWAHPPKMMNKEWIGERVSVVDIARVLGNVVLDRDDAGWGPNSTFKYPRHGGTGGLFDRMRPYVQENLRLCTGVASVDVERKQVVLKDGTREAYDILLNTTPVDLLVKSIEGEVPSEVACQAGRLRHSGSYIVGIGVEQPVPSKKCWMYFPEENSPFYRVTYLSNYSPEVVPDAARYYSLLAEVSHSEFKPVNRDTVVEDTIRGMINTKLLSESDRKDIVDAFLIERDYTYPTPSLERDAALKVLHPWLESRDIYSRGRFGAWRYEVGNMDHSVAQGVEWVNRILEDDRENELTYLAKRGC